MIHALTIKKGELDIIELDENNLLEELQKQVGGYIEVAYLGRAVSGFDLVAVINEEGKLKHLPPSLTVMDEYDEIVDVIAGPIVLLAGGEDGDFAGITKSQALLFLLAFETVSRAKVQVMETGEVLDLPVLPYM